LLSGSPTDGIDHAISIFLKVTFKVNFDDLLAGISFKSLRFPSTDLFLQISSILF
jgi:hypothetical protein